MSQKPQYPMSQEVWEVQKQRITNLYNVERKPLKDVRRIMEEKHFFKATVKMYKDRITHWGLDKRQKEHEVRAVLRTQHKRSSVGKKTVYHIRGKPVDLENVLRFAKRKGLDLAQVVADENPTPSSIEYWTPSAAPSPQASPEVQDASTESMALSSTNILRNVSDDMQDSNLECIGTSAQAGIWLLVQAIQDYNPASYPRCPCLYEFTVPGRSSCGHEAPDNEFSFRLATCSLLLSCSTTRSQAAEQRLLADTAKETCESQLQGGKHIQLFILSGILRSLARVHNSSRLGNWTSAAIITQLKNTTEARLGRQHPFTNICYALAELGKDWSCGSAQQIDQALSHAAQPLKVLSGGTDWLASWCESLEICLHGDKNYANFVPESQLKCEWHSLRKPYLAFRQGRLSEAIFIAQCHLQSWSAVKGRRPFSKLSRNISARSIIFESRHQRDGCQITRPFLRSLISDIQTNTVADDALTLQSWIELEDTLRRYNRPGCCEHEYSEVSGKREYVKERLISGLLSKPFAHGYFTLNAI